MRIIETNDDLKAFLGELANAPYLALDTEFLRDQTYYPKLCLIQVAAPGIEGIIDPLAPGIDLKPFYELIARPDIVKVLHAARQDIEIFYLQGGVLPDPLFDSQVAAMVCGFGDAASYETLARKVAHVEIDKSARFTDWSHRPLSKRQLEYALADVTHLRVIYEWMKAKLEKTGRASWVAEEVANLQDPTLYKLDPELAWKRLKPRTSNKKFLAVLASLAAWREREAQARDIPRGRVLKDEALTEIAAHPPENPEALERIRAVPKGFANSKLGKGLSDAIAAGLTAEPPEGAITENKQRRRREPSAAVVDLLKTLLRLRAEAANVAPRLIANAEDIEKLAAGEDDDVAALHGWRNDVFGKDAIALRKGDLAIALENGEAVVVELEEKTNEKIAIAAAMAAYVSASQAQPMPPAPQPAIWTTMTLTGAAINAPANIAWEKIGGNDWCAIAKYLDVKGCAIDSGKGELGSVRTIDTGTAKIVEIAVARTPYSYTYAQPFTPIFYHGTLAVEAVDATHSKLVYTLIWNGTAVGDAAAQTAAKEGRRTRFQAAVDKMVAAANAP